LGRKILLLLRISLVFNEYAASERTTTTTTMKIEYNQGVNANREMAIGKSGRSSKHKDATRLHLYLDFFLLLLLSQDEWNKRKGA
jgi:hypothetical protein